MNVFYTTPFSIEKDLGAAYNQSMQLLSSPDDWMVFTDGDTMFMMPDYGTQIHEIISMYPDTGLFTCLTNRVGQVAQCANGIISDDPNLLNLKRVASFQQSHYRHTVKELDHVISGHLMAIKKSTWDLIHGAPEGRGLLAIDNHISRRVLDAGLKIRVMEGVYICHFYRLDKNIHDRSHLNVDPTQAPNQPVRRKRSRFLH